MFLEYKIGKNIDDLEYSDDCCIYNNVGTINKRNMINWTSLKLKISGLYEKWYQENEKTNYKLPVRDTSNKTLLSKI